MVIRRIAALVAIALLVVGCSSGGRAEDATDGSGGELQGTRWVLASFASEGALVIVPDTLYADAEFTAGRVKGFAGCNEYDAVYRTGTRLLLVSMPKVTQAACADATNAFESGYLALLGQSRFYGVRADTLIIRGADRQILLTFDAAPRNPLLGSWFVDSYVDATGTVTEPLEGTVLTAVFRLAKVGGSSGCNTYQGPYTTNGTIAAIGPLATTRMACDETVMAQETAFLAALQGVGLVAPRASDTIELQDRSGGVLVALSRPTAPEPLASPSLAPSASPTAAPSRSPSAKPSAPPTASPTPAPTPTPAASATPAPTVAPPESLPPTATCDAIAGVNADAFATIVYPADWFTVDAPPAVACRYFDPAAITVPADPTTLSTAVMIKANPVETYPGELAAATEPADWTVITNEAVTISDLPATRIEATSKAEVSGYPVGTTRYAYLIDVGGAPIWIETSGTIGEPAYTTNVSIVDLIAAESTFATPS